MLIEREEISKLPTGVKEHINIIEEILLYMFAHERLYNRMKTK